MMMYATEGSDVSFQIPIARSNIMSPQLIWANDLEECVCPPYVIITRCACNINSHSLPRASYSEDALHFTNLTIQANNTKVYLVNSMNMPINLREIYKAYQIIILGKCKLGGGGGGGSLNFKFSPKVT